MKPIVKLYNADNITIRITDFKLQNVSYYGCDALFYYEIRDLETGILLDTSCETIEAAFMGIDDSEDVCEFLEDKGIDFTKDYDDNYDRLPAELKKEFEQHELEMYDDMYHDYFFEADDGIQAEMSEKIKAEMILYSGQIYVIRDGKVGWISVTDDYFGVHLKSDDVPIRMVYNMNDEDWIYAVDDAYFIVMVSCDIYKHYSLRMLERDEDSRYVVTSDDLANDAFPYFDGDEGDVLYCYYEEDHH